MDRFRTDDKTVRQQSTTFDPRDYRDLNVSMPMLGIILSIQPADRDFNRSAEQTEDRQGYLHECTVLIIDDASPAYMTLEGVLLTPDSPSGIDDFEERLPRPCSKLVTGELFDGNIAGIDPHDLDGDRCVVSFIGGKIDSAFVLRWWPHSRNVYDVATSGGGINGDTLQQLRRYFRRINGVETVITPEGDIIFSTTLANSTVTPEAPAQAGRLARETDSEEGGSVRVNIKPSQVMELTWNPQEEGIGVADTAEPSLPQTNPPQTEPSPSNERPNTYIYIDIDQIDIVVPGTALINAGEKATIQSPRINLEETFGEATDPVILGEEHRQWFINTFQVLSPFGPLKIDPSTVVAGSPYDDTQSTISFVE